jgi:hypothetical protein
LAPTTQEITVRINAPKLDVFDATGQEVMKHGFSIITSNERLGLITTDYKQLDESWGGGMVSRLFGIKNPELQLTTNIVTDKDASVLTILPKRRILHQQRGGHYDEINFSDSFLMKIREIGENIKTLAEAKK